MKFWSWNLRFEFFLEILKTKDLSQKNLALRMWIFFLLGNEIFELKIWRLIEIGKFWIWIFFFFFGIWLSQLSLTELTQLLAKFKCKGQNFGPPLRSFSLFFSFCFIFINFSFSINTIHLLLPLDFSSSSHHLFSQKTLF